MTVRGGEPPGVAQRTVPQKVKEAAELFLRSVLGEGVETLQTWAKAVWREDRLVRLAESVETAAVALWLVRGARGLNNLQGVRSEWLDQPSSRASGWTSL